MHWWIVTIVGRQRQRQVKSVHLAHLLGPILGFFCSLTKVQKEIWPKGHENLTFWEENHDFRSGSPHFWATKRPDCGRCTSWRLHPSTIKIFNPSTNNQDLLSSTEGAPVVMVVELVKAPYLAVIIGHCFFFMCSHLLLDCLFWQLTGSSWLILLKSREQRWNMDSFGEIDTRQVLVSYCVKILMSWLIVWSTNGVLTNGFWCPPSTETMSERKQEWCFAPPMVQGSPRILGLTTKKDDAGAKNAPGRNLHQSFDIGHHLAAGATSKAVFQNKDSTITMLILFSWTKGRNMGAGGV